jgi:hypothetical protein
VCCWGRIQDHEGCKQDDNTSIDDAAFEQSVTHRLAQLRNQGRFLLDGYRLDAMVDCIAIPGMMQTATKTTSFCKVWNVVF